MKFLARGRSMAWSTVGSAYPDDKVNALNAATGAKLWSYATGGPVGSPAVANGVVYVGSNDENVYALDAATGAKLWSYAHRRRSAFVARGGGEVDSLISAPLVRQCLCAEHLERR